MERRYVRDANDRAFEEIALLLARGYPVLGLVSGAALDARERDLRESVAERNARWAVIEDGGAVVACGREYDFTMRVRDRDVATAGIGSIVVAQTHKRRGLARRLVGDWLAAARADGAVFAVLHAFRPDFYRALGFGYGTRMSRFRFDARALPDDPARRRVRALVAGDEPALIAAHDALRERTNGLIAKSEPLARRQLHDPAIRAFGLFDEDGTTCAGYLICVDDLGPPGTANTNALVVREFVARDPAARRALLAFLGSQADQSPRILIETQDDSLVYDVRDPRDGSDVTVAPPAYHRTEERGIGVMYRVLDLARALEHLPGSAGGFAVAVETDDTLVAGTGARAVLQVDAAGCRAAGDGPAGATLQLELGDLASWITGAARLRELADAGRVTLDEATLTRLDRWSRPDRAPWCTTRF